MSAAGQRIGRITGRKFEMRIHFVIRVPNGREAVIQEQHLAGVQQSSMDNVYRTASRPRDRVRQGLPVAEHGIGK